MRNTLPSEKLSPEAAAAITTFHADAVEEVVKAIGSHRVVVVGMAGNPFVIKARKALTAAKVDYKYL